MHYIMYLIHSCSFVICFLWWWHQMIEHSQLHFYLKKKSSLNILCRTVWSSMWEVFAFIPGICAVLLLALCTVVFACKDSCWKMEHYVYSSSIEYWLLYITYRIMWFLDLYGSQNKIMYQKQKLDVLPSSYLLRYNFKVTYMVFVVGKMALGQVFLCVH